MKKYENYIKIIVKESDEFKLLDIVDRLYFTPGKDFEYNHETQELSFPTLEHYLLFSPYRSGKKLTLEYGLVNKQRYTTYSVRESSGNCDLFIGNEEFHDSIFRPRPRNNSRYQSERSFLYYNHIEQKWKTISTFSQYIYRGRRRFNYISEIRSFHFLIQLGYQNILDYFDIHGSVFFSTLYKSVVKYRLRNIEDYYRFMKVPEEDNNDLAPRFIPWKENNDNFGVWMELKTYFSDSHGFKGEAVMMSMVPDPLMLKRFKYYQLCNITGLILDVEDPRFAMFVPVSVGYGLTTSLLFNPEKFEVPVSKNRGNPELFYWYHDNSDISFFKKIHELYHRSLVWENDDKYFRNKQIEFGYLRRYIF